MDRFWEFLGICAVFLVVIVIGLCVATGLLVPRWW